VKPSTSDETRKRIVRLMCSLTVGERLPTRSLPTALKNLLQNCPLHPAI
jgi:hypothetical protein